jgi:hypothetical protein
MKLSKSELAEGITKELIDFVLKQSKCSPVQLMPGDEPQNLLECSSGYWVVLAPGQYLRDEYNKMIVIPVRDCKIGRARYLLNFGESEKKEKIQKIIETWKDLCRIRLDEIKKRIDSLSEYEKEDGMFTIIAKAANEQAFEFNKKMSLEQLKQIKPLYEANVKMFEDGQIIQLMENLGLRSFSPLMLSARFDNPQEMKVAINTFGANAINEWVDNGSDLLYKYAQIEVEKDFTY